MRQQGVRVGRSGRSGCRRGRARTIAPRRSRSTTAGATPRAGARRGSTASARRDDWFRRSSRVRPRAGPKLHPPHVRPRGRHEPRDGRSSTGSGIAISTASSASRVTPPPPATAVGPAHRPRAYRDEPHPLEALNALRRLAARRAEQRPVAGPRAAAPSQATAPQRAVSASSS